MQTIIELAVAGRTAYHWLNNSHRSIISADAKGYVDAVFDVICAGRTRQFKYDNFKTREEDVLSRRDQGESATINEMHMCFNIPDRHNDNIKPNFEVTTLLDHM